MTANNKKLTFDVLLRLENKYNESLGVSYPGTAR
jgi:hypothetical protein